MKEKTRLSDELRKLISAHMEGNTIRSIASTALIFGVNKNTLSDIVRKFKETGSYENGPKDGKNYEKADEDALALLGGYVEERHTYTLL